MPETLNFKIQTLGPISNLFLDKGIKDFIEAGQFISRIKYGRNKNKTELTTVFNDNCGTCGTKHALLKLLLDEQKINNTNVIYKTYQCFVNLTVVNTDGYKYSEQFKER
jgi:hypothetical protein